MRQRFKFYKCRIRRNKLFDFLVVIIIRRNISIADAAVHMDLDGELGTLEAGKIADLIVVVHAAHNDNPTHH